jgi:Protein of unknown function (DUF4127)
MSRKIVGLPVDTRPVVYSQVQSLVASSGWDLLCPPASIMGHFRVPANHDALAAWLLENATDTNGFVLSFDMLLYGGLVPSRFIEIEEVSLCNRLNVVRALKKIAPHAPIYGFVATMRISNNNVNEEEKTYWAEFGELIWQWSFYSDRFDCLQQSDDARKAATAREAIPESIRTDYLASRTRNHAITQEILALAKEGVIDRLIMPQDDTAEFGFNLRERRELQALVLAQGLGDRTLIYPGADEVMHTLCAHLVAHSEARPALRFFLIPSEPHDVTKLRALYEDRPILESLENQVKAVGGTLVTDATSADVVLAFHTQGTAQGDWAMQRALPNAHTVNHKWVQSIQADISAGRSVALVDCAYANGADPQLIGAFASLVPLKSLMAYAGWNTASNTMGAALAQCVLANVRANLNSDHLHRANQQNLALRFLEDYLYQAIVRQVVRIGLPQVLDSEALRNHVAEVFIPLANAWLRGNDFPFTVTSIALPWNRTFEIDIQLQSTAEASST